MPTVTDATLAADRRAAIALTLALTLLFVAGGLYFASLQNLWVDETTQLSGIRLAPGELIAWLAGRMDPAFGVPPDRMPPVSYLIDSACGHTLCAAPVHFRWLHLTFTAAGVAMITWIAAMRYSWRAAAVTGAFLVLSPKLTDLGVEIRAYPLFFFLTCVQIALIYRLSGEARLRTRDVAAFVLLSIGSIYTHFFGLVSSMALLTGLLAGRLTDRRDAILLTGAGALVLVSAAGIIPFITAASSFSGTEVADVGAGAYAKYALRLFGHSATMLERGAAALFFAGIAVLLLLSLARLVQEFRRDGVEALRRPLWVLLIALVAGIAVTLLASVVVRTFNPLKPHYNLWAFPIFALLLGSAVARPAGSVRSSVVTSVALAGALALVAGAAWSQLVFLSHARWFVHGPGDAIAAEVARAPERTAVVYRGLFGWGYFPTYFRYRDSVPQWLIDRDGELHRVVANGRIDPAPADPRQALTGRRLILADIQNETYQTLRVIDRGAAPESIPILAGPAPAFDGWRSRGSVTVPDLYWTRLTFFEPVEG